MDNYIVTVDAVTGSTLYYVPSSISPLSSTDLFYWQYDTATNNIYGILADWSGFSFALLNNTTGNFQLIDSIAPPGPFPGGFQYSAFNRQNGWYVFTSQLSGELEVYDTPSGAVLYHTQFNFNCTLVETQLDQSSGKLYGLVSTGNSSAPYGIEEVDVITGLCDSTPLPILGMLDVNNPFLTCSTFDSNHGRYIIAGRDASNVWRLYTIDVHTGNVLFNPPIPLFPPSGSNDNILEIHYDNTNDSIYALHWGDLNPTYIPETKEAISISFYPNPFASETVLSSDKMMKNATLDIRNCIGQTVRCVDHVFGQSVQIERGNLSAGCYFVSVIENGQKIARKKMIVIN